MHRDSEQVIAAERDLQARSAPSGRRGLLLLRLLLLSLVGLGSLVHDCLVEHGLLLLELLLVGDGGVVSFGARPSRIAAV